MKNKETQAEKEAVAQILKKLAKQTVKTQTPVSSLFISRQNAKKSDSHLATVSILQDEKPTFAGESQEKLTTKEEEPVLAAEGDTTQENDNAAEKAMLNKMSVVLSRAVRHAMSNGQSFTPANVGLSGRPTPMPAAAPPMPIGAPQAQQQPQQPSQNPAQYQAALGGPGATSPSSNPINNYGPLSASGDINGNAAFGVKNSPDSNKSGSALDSLGLEPKNFLLPAVGTISGGVHGGMTGPKNKKLLSALRGAAAGGIAGIGGELGYNAARNTLGDNAGGFGIGAGGSVAALLAQKMIPQVKGDKKEKKEAGSMDAKKYNDFVKLVSKGDSKEINKVMQRGGADASNLSAMISKARSHQAPPAKQAGSISKILDQAKAVEEGKKVENVKAKFTDSKNKADLDPTAVISKAAKWMGKEAKSTTWGGQRWQLGQTGINPQAGYGYFAGMIPTPDVALRVGTPSFGLGVGLHPLPYVFADRGQPSGRHGKQPRSLYKYIGDGMMSADDAFFIEMGKIPDGAPPERFEKLLRDRGIGRTSQEIKMLSEVLASSPDVKRNAMTRRLPAAVNNMSGATKAAPAPAGASSLADIKPEGMKIGADMMAPYLKQNQQYQQMNRWAGLATPTIANQIGRVAGIGPLAGVGATAAHMGVGHALNKQRQMMKSVQSMQNIFGK